MKLFEAVRPVLTQIFGKTLLWSPRMRQFNIFYYEHKHVKSGVTQPAINGRCWVSMNEAKRQPDIPTHIHAGQENLMAEIKSCKFKIYHFANWTKYGC